MRDHATQRPDAPALREKDFGIWQTLSWARSPRWCASSPAAWRTPGCSAASTWS
jgi:hypothetical protein